MFWYKNVHDENVGSCKDACTTHFLTDEMVPRHIFLFHSWSIVGTKCGCRMSSSSPCTYAWAGWDAGRWMVSQHSIKQQTFTNAYLLICHHKKRRNSMTYLTNIDSFSRALLDSYPPNLSMSKSNPMPSLSMDAHSLFQKPTKAWYAMKSITSATSMSFAGATKVNGLHCTFIRNSQEKWSDLIHLRLPPTKQMDHLPTLPNAKHSWVIQMLWRVYLLYCSWSQHGVLDNPSWQTYAMPVHDHLTLAKVLLPPSSNGTSLFIGHIPRENVRTIHWHDLHHCLSRWHTCFCAFETEYLGFILTREGQQQKVNAILQVTLPCNIKQVQSFVGMQNHYKAMIPDFLTSIMLILPTIHMVAIIQGHPQWVRPTFFWLVPLLPSSASEEGVWPNAFMLECFFLGIQESFLYMVGG